MSSPFGSLSSGRRSPFPRFRASERWASSSKCMANQVKEYIARYPSVLEDFLLQNNVSAEYLQGILLKKRKTTKRTSLYKQRRAASSLIKYASEMGIAKLCHKIITCTKDEEICERIYEICQVVGHAVDSDKDRLYVTRPNGVDLALYEPEKGFKVVGPVGKHLTVSAHVAVEKKSLNIMDLPQDSRFPKGIALGDESAHYVMAIPIVLEDGRCFAVAEFSRGWTEARFEDTAFELTNAIFCWINACVQKININKLMKIHEALNEFLLETTKVMFDDIYNIDHLVNHIMIFTKNLVSADRCALFLVDEEREELYADMFDEGKQADDGTPVVSKKSQIRFPRDRGIAGHVAKTGEIVNIKDAYKDARFNPEIDKKTGYHTKNILCMPISGKHGVIGVVQMINRINGDCFTQDDEDAFRLFAVYCALALHYSRVYSSLTRQQTMHKVAMEVLEFHISCTEESVAKLKSEYRLQDDKIPEDFFSFDFCAYSYAEILPHLFIKMIHDTFGEDRFAIDILCRFTLTVRKNYRQVAYHNWEHGFHVAHAIWRMIQTSKDKEFTLHEKLALLIGAICHDIDHRGYNNEFFKKMDLPLAALYSSSIMESHHYQQTVTILHAEGHDIFSFLKADEHKEVLDKIRQTIIATDLSLYFGNQKYLANLLEKEEFSMDIPEHRDALIALMMTGADLCAVPKPWETQKHTAECLYEEFWIQGDEEKLKGNNLTDEGTDYTETNSQKQRY
ncbi:cAMP and cAMP-inhibited cGMP 3',5'-cyclic phosphodiesterase 10A-like [Mercenaria mercenaria]|uniref:cAMP and cAMP-inhibited cGMP 3',5'-cyclic phosphodiesterase 10A-like n=1 Tax=Mercenaria mercenaria TaxID=6596 RepID=UPI00234ED7C2|nr:cAMP and cAMP-inhibited cGMP 3',5'-cyclic phosphodiesterase 10A-like [Mercenaria mercenaria]